MCCTWSAGNGHNIYLNGALIGGPTVAAYATIGLSEIVRFSVCTDHNTSGGSIPGYITDFWFKQGFEASGAQVAAIQDTQGGADGTGYGWGDPDAWLGGPDASLWVDGTNLAPGGGFGNFSNVTNTPVPVS